MKLYYSPGACSMSPHIVLREAGLKFELEKVDLRNKTFQEDKDYRNINPKGYVPALTLDDGDLLTEGPAIVQYIADLEPEAGLAPAAGTMERYHLQEWLNYIATELHKSFGPLVNPAAPEQQKQAAVERLKDRFRIVDNTLAQRDYLVGNRFSAADAYLFTILHWTVVFKLEFAEWPNLARYREQIAKRPAVQETLRTEGLRK